MISARNVTEQMNTQRSQAWLDYASFFRRLAAEAFESAAANEGTEAEEEHKTYAFACTAAYIACGQKGAAMMMPADAADQYIRLAPAKTDALLEYASGRHISPEDLATLRAEGLVEMGADYLTAEGVHVAECVRNATD